MESHLTVEPEGCVGAEQPCPFCAAVHANDRPLLARTASSAAFEDLYPSSPGHVLVVPVRHVSRVLDLTAPECADLFAVAREQLCRLERELTADGYTIGINDGPASGQTVPHVHLHLIPRSWGDVVDPRAGIRWVLPHTANY